VAPSGQDLAVGDPRLGDRTVGRCRRVVVALEYGVDQRRGQSRAILGAVAHLRQSAGVRLSEHHRQPDAASGDEQSEQRHEGQALVCSEHGRGI
jgi:hypothetical protein